MRRFGNVVWSAVERQLSFLKTLNEPFWLLIFPEGTRFSPKKSAIIESSRLYCESIGIPVCCSSARFSSFYSIRISTMFNAAHCSVIAGNRSFALFWEGGSERAFQGSRVIRDQILLFKGSSVIFRFKVNDA